MNADDPKFTAYALDELDPAERAAIETELRDQPALARECAEMRRFTAELRAELQAEESTPLAPEQRAAVLAAARIVPGPRAWWKMPWLQSAAAACVIVGVSAALLARTKMRAPEFAAARGGGVTVAVPAEMELKHELNSDPSIEPGKVVAEAKPASAMAQTDLSLQFHNTPVDMPVPPASTNVDGLASQPGSGSPAAAIAGLSVKTPPLAVAAPRTTTAGAGRLLDEAQDSYKAGRYDLAMKRSDKVLEGDPYNISARKLQERIHEEQDHYAGTAYNETRSRLMWKADHSWAAPARKFALAAGTEQSSRGGSSRGFAFGDADPAKPNVTALGEEAFSDQSANTEAYDTITDNAFLAVKDQPL